MIKRVVIIAVALIVALLAVWYIFGSASEIIESGEQIILNGEAYTLIEIPSGCRVKYDRGRRIGRLSDVIGVYRVSGTDDYICTHAWDGYGFLYGRAPLDFSASGDICIGNVRAD